jgi:hypothetical protein
MMTTSQKDTIIRMFVAAAEKFVTKVEDGRARSVETYADLKACLEATKTGYSVVDTSKPLTELQISILQYLTMYGAMTDEALLNLIRNRSNMTKNPSSVRTRRAELVALGRVRNSLSTVPTSSGRSAILWEVTPAWVETGRKVSYVK